MPPEDRSHEAIKAYVEEAHLEDFLHALEGSRPKLYNEAMELALQQREDQEEISQYKVGSDEYNQVKREQIQRTEKTMPEVLYCMSRVYEGFCDSAEAVASKYGNITPAQELLDGIVDSLRQAA
jgi:hypothetical protein